VLRAVVAGQGRWWWVVEGRVAHRSGTGWRGPTRTRTRKPIPVWVQVENHTRNTAVSMKHRRYTVNPYGYVNVFSFWHVPSCFFLSFFCFWYV